MNEEEIEAIKELIDSSNLSLIGDGTMIVKNTTIATTLNYIEKLQKENEEYHRIKKELIRVNKKIYDVDTIDEFIKTIDELQKELEEKTTILMAGADKVKQLEKENAELKKDISNMYDKEVIISVMCDNFDITRIEALEMLGEEE